MSTPLSRSDTQVLIGLRIVLAALIGLTLISMALNVVNANRYGAAVTVQLLLRSILGMLPAAAVLVAVSVRTPPAALALDAAAGLGIASLIFRFTMAGVTGLFLRAGDQPQTWLSLMLLWMAAYSALDAALAGLALYLRGRVGRISVPSLIVAVVAFLIWDGVVQAAMQLLTALLY